jgi:hypothetical protein
MYRAHVLSSEAGADGSVKFDCWIQREAEVDVWVNVDRGHRSLVLPANVVLAITEDPGLTDAQKRAAIKALFKEQAKGWGIDVADAAEQDIMSLIPSGSWPVDVDLDI